MSNENIKTWPERIYLQHGDSPEVPVFHEVYPGNGYSDGVTWCQDRIELVDVEYVRADTVQPKTPGATWRANGEPDPHDDRYDCERAGLCMGSLTDDELANAAFMNYDVRPSFQDVIDGKAFSPIVYMTAVKDRIRWLSRALEKAQAGAKNA